MDEYFKKLVVKKISPIELWKTAPHDNGAEVWDSGTSNMWCSCKVNSNPQAIKNGHGCKFRKIKHQSYRTTPNVKIRIPWQNPTAQIVSNRQVELAALPQHIWISALTSAIKNVLICKSRISLSGANGNTIHKFNLDSYFALKHYKLIHYYITSNLANIGGGG